MPRPWTTFTPHGVCDLRTFRSVLANRETFTTAELNELIKGLLEFDEFKVRLCVRIATNY